MDMHNDISKRTVLVLLVLTLVVSVVGTWTILSMPTTVYKEFSTGGPQEGKVHLGIQEPRTAAEPVPTTTEGRVGIYIAK